MAASNPTAKEKDQGQGLQNIIELNEGVGKIHVQPV